MHPERAVTIASLNLHGCHDRAGKPFGLDQACRALQADVVVLQETWRPEDGRGDPIGTTAAAFRYTAVQHALLSGTSLHSLGIPGTSPHATGALGLAVLTSLAVTSEATVDLGLAPGDMVRRAAQIVTVTVHSGDSLRIVNTHLTHRAYASPVQLRRLARSLSGGCRPTVIVGDLNMVWPMTHAASGYRRAVRGSTWPAHRPFVQLDHVLIDGRLTCDSGDVLDPLGSDHLPIRVRVHVTPA
ncbi:MAG: endonuclease/exonuclease/phosphatase family protein [Actinomycetota bacterium]|nr:endonuclease/exonuclease/phosphatase family protein [Actinomycetota bacterium]